MAETTTLLDHLTPPEMALVVAAEHLGGGGRESELQRVAASVNVHDVPPSTIHNHFSRAADTAIEKGALRAVEYGRQHQLWITERAWQELGHDEPVPTPPEPLFA